jgi:hypothetical protein
MFLGLPLVLLVSACGGDDDSSKAKSGSATGGAASGGSSGSATGGSATGGSGAGGASTGGSGGSSIGGSATGGGGSSSTGGSATGGSAGSSTGGSATGGSGGSGVLEECPDGQTCECNDGVDNDGDGLVDWHFDLGCTARNDATEGGVPSGSQEGGWTVFEPGDDTRIVYVSADGNDSNDGLSPDSPKRTLSAGLGQVRANSFDWLLLRRGDTFSGFGRSVSGRSPAEPVVIASYGTSIEQPILTDEEIRITGSNVVVAHLHFERTMLAVAGQASSNVLIEGNFFDSGNVVCSEGDPGVRSKISVRRNVSALCNTPYYFGSVEGLLVEENVVYRPSENGGGNHGMYITGPANSDTISRGNFVYYGKPAGDGIKQRPGGISENNVIASVEWSSLHFESTANNPLAEGVARNNLIVERRTVNSPGINFNGNWTGQMVDNIVADEPQGIDSPAFGGGGRITSSGNETWLGPADDSRPDLTILGMYNEDVLGGEATTVAFFEAVVQQKKFNFRPELTATRVIEYVRGNYVP